MSERAPADPITSNTIAFMRRERKVRRWSAADLAACCETFGRSQEPPIPSSLTRLRISKLETGKYKHIRVDEAWLLAGAFGVDIDAVLTDSAVPVPLEERDSEAITPHRTLRQQVEDLQRQMEEVRQTLEMTAD